MPTHDVFILSSPSMTEIAAEFERKLRDKIVMLSGEKKYGIVTSYLNYQDTAKSIRDCDDSRFLIAFFDVEVTYLNGCYDVCEIFFRKQESLNVGKNKINDMQCIIYPIKFDDVPTEQLQVDNATRRGAVLRQIHAAGFYNIPKQESAWHDVLDSIAENIWLELVNDPKITKQNTWTINDHIEKISDFSQIVSKAKVEIGKSQFAEQPVCVIYTGGTVGMIREKNEDGSVDFNQASLDGLVSNLPLLKELEFDVHFYSYEKCIDSSNIKSSHWISLAKIVERLYNHYQGFVIIHGANTMAYTASALSFMFDNQKKPIIITGSELPLTERGDAQQNVINALNIAAWISNKYERSLNEVCILFGKNLIRGNRATKKYSLDITEGFYSPNFREFSTLTVDKPTIDFSRLIGSKGGKCVVTYRDAVNLSSSKDKDFEPYFKCEPMSSKEVCSEKIVIHICDIYPDMDMGLFRAICEFGGLHALIIRTYGTGGVPDGDDDFVDILKDIISERNVIVVNLTQCPIGSVELRIFETNKKLFDIGVINGGDMLTEAAYCKLKYLFFQNAIITPNSAFNYDSFDYDRIKAEMTVDLKGEMSLSTYTVSVEKTKFSESGNFEYSTMNSINSQLDHQLKFSRDFDNYKIYNAVLRFEDLNCINSNDESVTIKVDIVKNSNNRQTLIERSYNKKSNKNVGYWNLDVTREAKDVIISRSEFYISIKADAPVSFASVSLIVSVAEV